MPGTASSLPGHASRHVAHPPPGGRAQDGAAALGNDEARPADHRQPLAHVVAARDVAVTCLVPRVSCHVCPGSPELERREVRVVLVTRVPARALAEGEIVRPGAELSAPEGYSSISCIYIVDIV